MITYKPVKLPAGPIKVEWQTDQKNGGAWVVQLPKAPGLSYFGSPSSGDIEGTGIRALSKPENHVTRLHCAQKRDAFQAPLFQAARGPRTADLKSSNARPSFL